MRNRIILYIILIFVFVTTQVTFLNFVSIFGIKPNLIIILIVSISLLEGRVQGAAIGFFSGLCLDAVVGIALGIQALFGMLLGLVFGNINKRLFKENILVMAVCTFFSTILYEAAVAITTYLVKQKIDIYMTFKTIILPEAVINSILGLFIFLFIILINRKMFYSEGKNKY